MAKILLKELRDFLETGWVDGNAIEADEGFDWDDYIENSTDEFVSKEIMSSTYAYRDSDGKSVSITKEFNNWKDKQEFEWIKIPKTLVNNVLEMIRNNNGRKMQ